MTAERWLPIPGHDNYEVSDHGRVRRSKPGKGARVGRILRQRPNRDGYYYVRLSGGSKDDVWHEYVHRLVATAFLPQPSLLDDLELEAHHKKPNLADNSLANVEWVTPSENKKQAWVTRKRNGRRAKVGEPAPWEGV